MTENPLRGLVRKGLSFIMEVLKKRGRNTMRKTALFLSLCVFISAIAGCGAQKQETPETVTEVVEETVESGDTKTITDMRGKEVEIRASLCRL